MASGSGNGGGRKRPYFEQNDERDSKRAKSWDEKDVDVGSLLSDVEQVASKLREQSPPSHPDPNLIYMILEANQYKPDRVNLVLKHFRYGSSSQSAAEDNDIITEVETIMKALPSADGSVIFSMLQSMPPGPDRLGSALKLLRGDSDIPDKKTQPKDKFKEAMGKFGSKIKTAVNKIGDKIKENAEKKKQDKFVNRHVFGHAPFSTTTKTPSSTASSTASSSRPSSTASSSRPSSTASSSQSTPAGVFGTGRALPANWPGNPDPGLPLFGPRPASSGDTSSAASASAQVNPATVFGSAASAAPAKSATFSQSEAEKTGTSELHGSINLSLKTEKMAGKPFQIRNDKTEQSPMETSAHNSHSAQKEQDKTMPPKPKGVESPVSVRVEGPEITTPETPSGGSCVIEDVALVNRLWPQVNPNEVFNMLQERENDPKRVEIVLNILREKEGSNSSAESRNERSGNLPATNGDKKTDDTTPTLESRNTSKEIREGEEECGATQHTPSSREAGVSEAGASGSKAGEDRKMPGASDSIDKDVQAIAWLFPNINHNQIYDGLKTAENVPNRVQIVIKKLLDQIEQDTLVPPGAETKVPSGVEKQYLEEEDMEIGEESISPLAKLRNDLETLVVIFPDCDPYYIVKKLKPMLDKSDRVESLAQEMVQNKDFPKLSDRLDKARKQARHKQSMSMELSISDMLKIFPDPIEYFYNEQRVVEQVHQGCRLVHLMNTFPRLKISLIKKTLSEKKGHLVPALRQLEKLTDAEVGQEVFLREKARSSDLVPKQADQLLYWEVMFIKHEQEIKDFLWNKKMERARRVEEAREGEELQECGVCGSNEVLIEEAFACRSGHMFCRECIHRSVTESLATTATNFPCLADCNSEFSLKTLHKVLPVNIFSLLLKRLLKDKTRKLEVSDMATCPFCPFKTLLSSPDVCIFKCFNPKCLKQSCRPCGKLSHPGESCETGGLDAAGGLDTAEVSVVWCTSCMGTIIKTDSCNKISCTCGATMCYLCRQAVQDFMHFEKCIGRGDILTKLSEHLTAAEEKAAEEEDIAEEDEERVEEDEEIAEMEEGPHVSQGAVGERRVSSESDEVYEDARDEEEGRGSDPKEEEGRGKDQIEEDLDEGKCIIS